MSRWTHEEITCGACGERFAARVVDGLSITRNSDIYEALRAGKLHLFDCPGCGRRVLYEKPAVYTDIRRRRFALVNPRDQMGAWRQVEDDCRDLYQRHIVHEPTGALFSPEDVEAFWVRAVFGYDRLREKLIVLDAGWDDRVVEVMKLMLLGGHPDLMARGYHDLVVTDIDAETGAVEVFAVGPRGEPGLTVTGSRALYDALAADASLPTRYAALWEGSFVDYRRVTLD